jgi:hypothetical protein
VDLVRLNLLVGPQGEGGLIPTSRKEAWRVIGCSAVRSAKGISRVPKEACPGRVSLRCASV